MTRIKTTLVEPVDLLRQQLQGNPPPIPSAAASGAALTASNEPVGFQRFRPQLRPSTLLLRVVDDGIDAGETIRVRADRFVVGRVTGDLVVPHDPNISSQHFEIVRVVEDGICRWCVRDLQSTNGTFVNVAAGLLKHNQELVLGSFARRLRFDVGGQATPEFEGGSGDRKATSVWHARPAQLSAQSLPALIEMTRDGRELRHHLVDSDHTIGSGAGQCTIALHGDPFVEPRHCRIFRDDKQRWRIENLSTVNGTWLRIDEVTLDGGGWIQAGEQRFALKVL